MATNSESTTRTTMTGIKNCVDISPTSSRTCDQLTDAPDKQGFARQGLHPHWRICRNPFAIHRPREFLDYVFTQGTPNLPQSPLRNRNTHLCREPDQIPHECAARSLLVVQEARKQINNSTENCATHQTDQRTCLRAIA